MDATSEFPGFWSEAVWNSPGRESDPGFAEDPLVAAAVSGDDDAFRRLVERHQERIYHFCYQWLRNAEDAREACQDTFVRAYQSLGRYRDRGKFSTWLYKIALNQCRDRHKSKGGRQGRETMMLSEISTALSCHRPAPDENAANSGDLEKLRQGIEALPEKLRAVMIICGVEGLSQEVCAEILNCSVRAVEGRLYRARRLLMEWWEREE